MANNKTGDEIYDVNKYTDDELFNILDLINPSDRELEAKIHHMIRKYKNMQTDAGDKLAWFFNAIYERFFEIVNEDESALDVEYPQDSATPIVEKMEGENQTQKTTVVNQVEYTKDNLNPILKQTITRILSIDSQYRDNKKKTMATNFNFNLTDTLRDVVSVRLNSIQIPKTWYTISKSYGANFFYLKGNSPGIDNGNHDYKIAISVGNYKAKELIDTINDSITTMKATYTDCSFGNTGFDYGTNSCKATFNVHIEKIYNESDYALSFPSFTYPSEAEGKGNYTSIPQMLGYDMSYIPLNSVYGERTIASSGDADVDADVSYNLNNSNNYFTIVNYNGYDTSNGNYISADASYARFLELSYNTIKIKSTLLDGSYSRQTIWNDFNAVLQSNTYDLSGASIKKLKITDASMEHHGNSYFQFVVPLNRLHTTNAKNAKTAVLFPEETGDVKLWTGASSCFRFDASINEVSTIKSAAITNKSNYAVGDNVYFTLECIANGYGKTGNFSANDVQVDVSNGEYNLYTYIDAINAGIVKANNANNAIFDACGNGNVTADSVSITSFSIGSKTNNHLRMRFYMNKKFTTTAYSFDPTDCIFNEAKFNFTSTVDLSNTTDFSSNVVDAAQIYSLTDGVLFKIKPNGLYDNSYAASFDISLNCADVYANHYGNTLPDGVGYTDGEFSSVSYSDLANILNYTITNWTDPVLQIKPLENSSIDVSNNTVKDDFGNESTTLIFTLHLSVNAVLSNKDYQIVFTDASNSWSDYLHLDPSYSLSDWSYNSSTYYDVSYAQFDNSGKDPIYGNLLTLYSGVNNYFYLDPMTDGVADSTHANRITIAIDASANGTKYSLDELRTAIKAKYVMYKNGSSLAIDANNYAHLRINHSKMFKTSDYRIVFYDPYSFVRCFVGSSAVQNTSWDTTIGWILGFRDLTEYPLKYGTSYVVADTNDSTVTYYQDTGSYYTYNETTNIASIVGDTTVSVNLYNYFMIVLDDYTQNHLNDGLVTIAAAETGVKSSSYANHGTYTCDPVTGNTTFSGTTLVTGNKNTANQIYAENQKIISNQPVTKYYSAGPFAQDIFAIIPLNVAGLDPGSAYIETSSSLTKQERMYFGPVNISRMHIKLINDRGDTVDLNGSDWSCTLQCDQLYQQKSL
jgi:hypothetical protein